MDPDRESRIEQAVGAVRAGTPQSLAARHFKIPRTTLQRRLRGAETRREANQDNQRLGQNQESFLADWVLLQAQLGLPPTHGELRWYAEQMLFNGGDSRPLGKHWVQRFLARNPVLQVHRSRGIEGARFQEATTANITAWWPFLQIPAVTVIKPENRWNMDEVGLQEGIRYNGLVLGAAGIRPLLRKSNKRTAWTTMIEAVSATGCTIPPLVIFKGKNVQKQWFPVDMQPLADWQFTCTPNGWTDNKTAVKWLRKVFIPATRPAGPDKRLLIMDGHKSHVTKEFMLFCI